MVFWSGRECKANEFVIAFEKSKKVAKEGLLSTMGNYSTRGLREIKGDRIGHQGSTHK